VVGATLAGNAEIAGRYLQQPWLAIFPLAALAAVIAAWFMVRRERYFVAFMLSAAMIAGLMFSAGIGIYPNLLISSENARYNLTLVNAASQPATLTVMLVIALIGIPFVLLYTAGVYYLFRGKVQLGSGSY
jgi:cytochrome d ubiquinol oxidase subunit II